MADHDDPPAIDAPGVRSVLVRYRNRGRVVLLIGGALLVVFVVAANAVESRARQLEEVGQRVEGTVAEVNPAAQSGGDIHVEFAYGGRQRRSVVHLNDSSPRYAVGQPVTVLVDPMDEERVTLPSETNQSRSTVVAMSVAFVVGLYATIVGTSMVVRVRRQRRVLQAHPWRVEDLQFGFRRDSGAGAAAVRLGDASPVVLAPSLRHRIERSGLATTSLVEVAGDPLEHVVLRPPGTDALFSGRPPRSRWSRRRWAARLR